MIVVFETQKVGHLGIRDLFLLSIIYLYIIIIALILSIL